MAKVTRLDGKNIYLDGLDRASSNYCQWMKDKEVLRFLAEPDGDFSPSNLAKYIADINVSPKDYLFGIFNAADDAHIGNIKIGNVHPRHRYADLGIIVGVKEFWGKGIATEAIMLRQICVGYIKFK